MPQPPNDKERRLAEAAERALLEAKKRKEKAKPLDLPTELGGRDGPEPTRFGDWEKDGVVTDF
jgi:hypothetical protein